MRGQFARFCPSSGSEEDSPPPLLRHNRAWRIEDTELPPPDESVFEVENIGDGATSLQMVKYIDDSNFVETLRIEEGRMHVTTGKRRCLVRAEGTEGAIGAITDRAEQIGMLVNDDKTQSLCISTAKHTEVSSFIAVGDGIHSSQTLKMLGFVFGASPSTEPHVQHLSDLFRGRFWSLVHMKSSGIRGDRLFNMYKVFVRPVLEYCCTVFHPLLTREQEDVLESFQRKVFRLCYGDKSYSEEVDEGRIETLRDRREKASDVFVTKALKNRKFDRWFPARGEPGMELRSRRPVAETEARTCRNYNGPIAAFRRRANDLIVAGRATYEAQS